MLRLGIGNFVAERVGSIDGNIIPVPLVGYRLRTAGHHFQQQGFILTKNQFSDRLLPDRDRLHHSQLDLLADRTSGRVFHHHLIAAFVGFTRVGDCQYWATGSVDRLAVESPRILNRLCPLRRHGERRGLSLDHPRLLRLLRDRDRHVHGDPG